MLTTALPHLSLKNKLLAARCRESFWRFVQEFWEEVPGVGKMVPSWHMEVLADEIQKAAERVFRGEPKEYDLIFNVPFGTSKSSLLSILFHPWTWTRMPEARHMTATHTDMLALDLSNKSREVIRSAKYQTLFPEIKIVDNQDAKGFYRNAQGGVRQAFTVGGKNPMGFHFHFLGVDDPIDPQKAVSQAEIINAKNFMNGTLPSRKVDKAVALTFLVMQRLHVGDPTAVLEERAAAMDAGRIRKICLPGELTEDTNPEYRHRYSADGLLDVNRLSRPVLKEYRATLGAYGYASQVLQNPRAVSGGMFQPQWFNHRVKAAPYHVKWRVRYIDRAATAEGGCATAAVLMCCDEEDNIYVEHCEHGHWEPAERNQRIYATALRDRARYPNPRDTPTYVVEAERGSTGEEGFRALARILHGFKVQEDSVTGSKDSRAEPWASQLAAGNVKLVDDGTWDLQGYVDEHVSFKPDPMISAKRGKLKDRVDASSGVYNLFFGPGKLKAMRVFNITKKRTDLKIVVCSRQDLQTTIIEEHYCLLVALTDPWPKGSDQKPLHGASKLLDSVVLQFTDMDPAEYQMKLAALDVKSKERWDDLIPPYDKSISDLVMKAEDGKRMWQMLMQKRDPPATCWLIMDEGDRRASSVAYAICDTMRLSRPATLYRSAEPEWKCDNNAKAANNHVYQMVKASRSLVI